MALHSLVVKLTKSLPLWVPGFSIGLDHKALDLSREVAAARDPTKYKSGIELLQDFTPLINQEQRLYHEHLLKTMRVCRRIVVLTGVGCVGIVGYAAWSL